MDFSFVSPYLITIWYILLFVLAFFIYFKWLHERIGLNAIQSLFFLGLILIIIGYSGIMKNTFVNYIISKLGDIFAISGVIGYLSSMDDILRPYRNELKAMIYHEKEYLEKLSPNEIENVWLNSSALYFNNRFKNINDELLKLLKDEYFSSKSKMYYENVDITYVIKFIDEQSQLISVEETTKMSIFTENKLSQPFTLESSIEISPTIRDKCSIDLLIMKINDKDVLDSKEIANFAVQINNNSMNYKVSCVLCGSETYQIHRKIEKVYSLKYDNSICYKSKNITKGLSVTFNVPDSLKLNVMERGLIDKFDLDNKETIPTICKFTYSSLILPKQGFSTIIIKK